ncbi:MAG: hypothetical protein WKF57_04355 [Nakamurella sp.]
MTEVAECLPCELGRASADAVVFRDDTWSCEVAPGYDVPGWYILRLRRHAEGWGELAGRELAEFGARSAQLSTAITQALGATHVYFMSFGENYPHFHFLVTARGADTPAEMRGANTLKLRETHRDMAGALALVPVVRAALHLSPLFDDSAESAPTH